MHHILSKISKIYEFWKTRVTQESWTMDMFKWLFFSFISQKVPNKARLAWVLIVLYPPQMSNVGHLWVCFGWHMNSNKPGRKRAMTVIITALRITLPWWVKSPSHTAPPQGQATNRGRIRRKKTMASSSPGCASHTVTLRHKWNLSVAWCFPFTSVLTSSWVCPQF